MLTLEELDCLLEYVPATPEHQELVNKLACARVRRLALRAGAAAAKPDGSLISNVTHEEAYEYSQRGEYAILLAAATTTPEQAHAKLFALTIGAVVAICRTLKIDRSLFCDSCVTDILFAAFKAAYNIGVCGNAGGKRADDQ